eukprot:scaffold234166_cov31-Tisochrysis_lutea.AAC.1
MTCTISPSRGRSRLRRGSDLGAPPPPLGELRTESPAAALRREKSVASPAPTLTPGAPSGTLLWVRKT